jgi:hypothetical protein
MATKALVRLIKGEPYWLTPATTNGGTWRVTSPRRESHYVVMARGPDGAVTAAPESCSCPSYHHRRAQCKHMLEVRRVLDEAAAEVAAYSMEAPSKPTLYRFAKLDTGRVRVERWDGGTLTEKYVLEYAVAVGRYQHLHRLGYRPFGFISRNERHQ